MESPRFLSDIFHDSSAYILLLYLTESVAEMLLEYVKGLDLLLSFELVMFMDLLKCCCNHVMVMKYDLICCLNLKLKAKGIYVQMFMFTYLFE